MLRSRDQRGIETTFLVSVSVSVSQQLVLVSRGTGLGSHTCWSRGL